MLVVLVRVSQELEARGAGCGLSAFKQVLLQASQISSFSEASVPHHRVIVLDLESEAMRGQSSIPTGGNILSLFFT